MGQEKDVEGKRIRKILKAFRLLVREMKAKIKKEKDIFTVRSRVKKGGGVTNEEFQHSVKTVSPPNTHTIRENEYWCQWSKQGFEKRGENKRKRKKKTLSHPKVITGKTM